MMKRTTFFVLLGAGIAIIGTGLVIGFEKNVSAPPKLKITPNIIHFGTLEPGEKTSSTCVLTNVGGQALTIERVIAQCACTATDLGSTKLEPGQSTSLRIHLDSAGYMRKLRKAVIIDTDHPNQRGVVILKAYVKVGVRANTRDLVIERLRPGDTATRTMELYYDRGQQAGPVRCEGLPEEFTVSADARQQMDEIDVQRIHIALTPALKKSGWYNADASISVGDDVVLPLRVRYEVLPAVWCEPSVLELPSYGSPANASVLCSDAYKLETVTVEAIHEKILPSVTFTSRQGAQIRVQPAADPGAQEDMDVLSVRFVVTEKDATGSVSDRLVVPVRVLSQKASSLPNTIHDINPNNHGT